VAYLRKVPRVVELIDSTLEKLGHAGDPGVLISTMGRTGGRNLETLYVAELMVEWIEELIEAIGGAGAEYFAPKQRTWGSGSGMWEAPRGALYHCMDIDADRIKKYQIIIPSTWNISPRDENGVRGPMEEALIGNPIANVEKPINALRTVHSFDPCVACAIHVSEPQTGKHFETVINPWGVK
jgi:hydrogenase large subunit